ncbi:MAG: GNAT family N-acetyltransferase, partial [Planctomycetota bacterium]
MAGTAEEIRLTCDRLWTRLDRIETPLGTLTSIGDDRTMQPQLHRSRLRDQAAALDLLRDEPIHVEPRGLLLGGGGVAFLGRGESSASPGSVALPGGFVFSKRHGLAAGFGFPTPSCADALEKVADETLIPGRTMEIHVPASVSGLWCEMLGLAPSASFSVQGLGAGSIAERDDGPAWSCHVVERIYGADDSRLETLSRGLREDFAAQERWPVVFAAMAGGAIASIASAAVETEGHFDVSIETAPAFRGEGFGRAAAAGLIRYQRQRDKEPVWIVSAENRASLALATSIG